MKNRYYISGKISGIEEEAPKHFERAEKFLVARGLFPVNPMKIEHNHKGYWTDYMKSDIKVLCDCDGIYMLNNWQDSKGAKIEFQLAKDLELNIIFE